MEVTLDPWPETPALSCSNPGFRSQLERQGAKNLLLLYRVIKIPFFTLTKDIKFYEECIDIYRYLNSST